MQPGEDQAECQAWCRPLSMRPPEHRTRSSSDPLDKGLNPRHPKSFPLWFLFGIGGTSLAGCWRKEKQHQIIWWLRFSYPGRKKTPSFSFPSPPDNWRCKAGFALAPLPYPKIVLFIFLMGCSKCDRCFCISRGSLEAGASGANGSLGVV